MSIKIDTTQRDSVLKEILYYIEKYNVTCGDDVINIDSPAIEAKYTMAEIVDIVLNTECKIK